MKKLSPEFKKRAKRVTVLSLTPVFLMLLTLQILVGWPVDVEAIVSVFGEIKNIQLFPPVHQIVTDPTIAILHP